MMRHRVVAAIVNYNSGELLKRAVDSLLNGSVQPHIEIVDNASTDGSIESVERCYTEADNVRFTCNPVNVGFAKGHNRVLRAHDAEFYLLLNPDCVVETETIDRFVSVLERRPEIGLAGGMLLNADGTIQKTSKRRFPTPWSSLARTLGLHSLKNANGRLQDFDLAVEDDAAGGVEYVEAISGAMMFVRGSALKDVGLLDEGYFMHCEDLDWCKRFWDAGYKVAYVPAARAVHLKGGSGRNARVIWHLHRSMLRFYEKHYRRRYPAAFAALVYPGVYLRCACLMTWSLVGDLGGRLAGRKPEA